MSLATAAKFFNISPKSDNSGKQSLRKSTPTGKNMKKQPYFNPDTSSQLSSTSKNLCETQEWATFKPKETGIRMSAGVENDMSFGGHHIMDFKGSTNGSTIMRTYDETRDTKDHEQDFFYQPKSVPLHDDE